jgi:hypothetical protein
MLHRGDNERGSQVTALPWNPQEGAMEFQGVRGDPPSFPAKEALEKGKKENGEPTREKEEISASG